MGQSVVSKNLDLMIFDRVFNLQAGLFQILSNAVPLHLHGYMAISVGGGILTDESYNRD